MSYLRIDKVTPLQKCNGNEDIYRSQKIQTSAPPPIETVPIRVPTVGSKTIYNSYSCPQRGYPLAILKYKKGGKVRKKICLLP